jgi:hypothetical protein
MKGVLSRQQLDLWQHMRYLVSVDIDEKNGVGPYKGEGVELITRNFDCSNYNACLTFAGLNSWDTFVCSGCRKTEGLVLR